MKMNRAKVRLKPWTKGTREHGRVGIETTSAGAHTRTRVHAHTHARRQRRRPTADQPAGHARTHGAGKKKTPGKYARRGCEKSVICRPWNRDIAAKSEGLKQSSAYIRIRGPRSLARSNLSLLSSPRQLKNAHLTLGPSTSTSSPTCAPSTVMSVAADAEHYPASDGENSDAAHQEPLGTSSFSFAGG